MDIRMLAMAALLPLAACAGGGATVEPAPPPATEVSPVAMQCKADAAQSYIGQKVTVELGAIIRDATGARTVRWGPPRSAMTMDYRPDRVNILYDDDNKITQVSCG